MKTFKKHLVVIVLSMLFYSCIDVRFVESQPTQTQPLKTFPEIMQGDFLIESNEANEIDTITIGEIYFTDLNLRKRGNHFQQERKKVVLSDSLVLKPIHKNYVLNFRDKEAWYLVLIKPVGKDNLLVLWIDGNNENSIHQLAKYTRVESILDDSNEIKAYRLQPTKNEFKKLVKDQAIFTRLYQLKKLNQY